MSVTQGCDRMLKPLMLSLIATGLLITSARSATLKPTNLRCEYRTNPVIDVTKPRLSWILESDQPAERGQKQTAYHILVASSPEQLKADKGDVWDSGKVSSDVTNQISYAGAALKSEQQLFWKARAWNGGDQPSAWSEPARWTMGLLDAADWKAKWIGYDAPAPPEPDSDQGPGIDLKGLKWVWTEDAQGATTAPTGSRYFRKKIAIPPDRKVKRALFIATADNNFILHVNGKRAGNGGDFHRQYNLKVAELIKPGADNIFAISAKNDGGPASLAGKLHV